MPITPLDMRPLVTRYANVAASRIRYTYGVDANGLRNSTSATTAILVSMQPISGEDLKRLPESFHTQSLFSFWSISELRARDILLIDGTRYELQHVENWNSAGQYWRALGNAQLAGEVP